MKKSLSRLIVPAALTMAACSGQEVSPELDALNELRTPTPTTVEPAITEEAESDAVEGFSTSSRQDILEGQSDLQRYRLETLFRYKDTVRDLGSVSILRDYCVFWPNVGGLFTMVRNPIVHIENVLEAEDDTVLYQIYFTSTNSADDARETLYDGPYLLDSYDTDASKEGSYWGLNSVRWFYAGEDIGYRNDLLSGAATEMETLEDYSREFDQETGIYRLYDRNGEEISFTGIFGGVDVYNLSHADFRQLCLDPNLYLSRLNEVTA